MKQLFFFSVILILFSCNRAEKIVNEKDYSVFLQKGFIEKEKNKVVTELNFWDERLMRDTGNFLNMKELASKHIQLFKLTGNVKELRIADSLLLLSTKKVNDKEASILYALSQNAIMQHHFKDAYHFNLAAEKTNSDPYINNLLDFDAAMELGKYYEASEKIAALKNKKSFDYLIRKAKLEDHYGKIDQAIELMEQASAIVKDKKESAYNWSLSNLADMYGHSGRVKDAYNAYIQVLEMDSSNLYCLKGIAWIAFSHDKNTPEAKRILNFILSQTNMPDINLILAEIAGWEGDTQQKEIYNKKFLTEVLKPGYGGMYNKYLIHLYTSDLKDYNKALAIALTETERRPTPETYNWLAYVYFNKGETEKAYQIVRDYVNKKSFEPDALMNMGFINAAIGKKDEARKLLSTCLESSFELGPVEIQKIKEKLKEII